MHSDLLFPRFPNLRKYILCTEPVPPVGDPSKRRAGQPLISFSSVMEQSCMSAQDYLSTLCRVLYAI